jgi:hypothetical protein
VSGRFLTKLKSLTYKKATYNLSHNFNILLPDVHLFPMIWKDFHFHFIDKCIQYDFLLSIRLGVGAPKSTEMGAFCTSDGWLCITTFPTTNIKPPMTSWCSHFLHLVSKWVEDAVNLYYGEVSNWGNTGSYIALSLMDVYTVFRIKPEPVPATCCGQKTTLLQTSPSHFCGSFNSGSTTSAAQQPLFVKGCFEIESRELFACLLSS